MLVKQAQLRQKERQAETERQKVRLNTKGGGRKPKLTMTEEVCLSLFYLRQMPTFEVLGMHFDVSKTEANDTFHYWLKIFREVLPSSLLEQVENQESDSAIVQEILIEFELNGGGKPPLLNSQQIEILSQLVEEDNDATLQQLTERLTEKTGNTTYL